VKDVLLVPNSALRYTPPRESASRGGGLMSLFRPPRMGRPQNRGASEAAAGKRTVWVLRNNNPESVSIETGSTDGQHTVVKSGELKADDLVITDASARNSG
jgi:HlyD family secretion protein